MLPFSTPVPSSIHPAPTVSIRPPSDERSPPIEVVPRRHILNKLSSSSDPHSPYVGTVRRQSQQLLTPSRNEGEQLARAAAYIRKRISRRSLTYDESVSCTPKNPPDKIIKPESDSRRLNTQVVNKELETSVTICSPGSEGSESLPVRSEAVPQQFEIWRANELSLWYSDSISQHPKLVCKVAQNDTLRSRACRRSPLYPRTAGQGGNTTARSVCCQ
jgi:hypothetical protein